jgi:oligoribonuclease
MSDLLSKKYIVWVDLEMTGLNIDKDTIIEMACLITDDQLNIIAENEDIVIHHSDEALKNMDEWCINQFQISGLTELARNSKISLEEAENNMVEFIKKYTPPGSCPLAGNSIHMDKIFLNKYMKNFMNHLHYRIIDVSSIKELGMRWNPDMMKNVPKKKLSHRALDDIKESIQELKYYQENFFKTKI